MYAIIFDLEMSLISNISEIDTCRDAYKDIRIFMKQNGFSQVQKRVYFGDGSVDAVKCVLTIQKLAKSYPWFAACAKDVRMLRIEENNDLLPAIRL